MKLYKKFGFARQHENSSNTNTFINCTGTVLIPKVPQQRKHSHLQCSYRSRTPAKVFFLFLVKPSVFAVHRAEYDDYPCRCRKCEHYRQNRQAGKLPAHIHWDKQYKTRTDIAEQAVVTVKTTSKAAKSHKRESKHTYYQKLLCKQPDQKCCNQIIVSPLRVPQLQSLLISCHLLHTSDFHSFSWKHLLIFDCFHFII